MFGRSKRQVSVIFLRRIGRKRTKGDRLAGTGACFSDSKLVPKKVSGKSERLVVGG